MALESNLFFRDLDEFMRFLLEVFSFLEKSYAALEEDDLIAYIPDTILRFFYGWIYILSLCKIILFKVKHNYDT